MVNKLDSFIVSLVKTAEDGPVDMMGEDDAVVEDDMGSEDLGGDMGDMGGGDLGGDMGGDMGGGDMGGAPSSPQLDYENIFVERTHDLEDTLEQHDTFDIDFSRLT